MTMEFSKGKKNEGSLTLFTGLRAWSQYLSLCWFLVFFF